MKQDLNQNKMIPKDSDLYFFSEDKYTEEHPEWFDK